MQIVIDIDDMAYKFVQNSSFVEDESTLFMQTNADRKKTLFLFDILDAIKNGTPLPKEHRGIVDLKNVQWAFDDAILEEAQRTGRVRATHDEIANILGTVPTIIEADTESEANK